MTYSAWPYVLPTREPGAGARDRDQARRRGWEVMAHVERAADFRRAVAAGLDEMAHVPGYGAPTDDFARYGLAPADARATARRGVSVITTS